jgi:hypothetical protein
VELDASFYESARGGIVALSRLDLGSP